MLQSITKILLSLAWRRGRENEESVTVLNGSSTQGYEILPITEPLGTSQKQATLPCFMVSTFVQNQDFCGRSDILASLDAALLPISDSVVSGMPGKMRHAALCGMGGIGKTETALHFIYTRRDKFDAIFWIRSDDRDKLENDFSRITTALGLEDTDEKPNLVVSREIAKGWLSNPTSLLDPTYDTVGQREAAWLIVFDNADDPDVLVDFYHIFGSGSVLITSRHPLSKEFFSPDTVGIDLEPLAKEDAAELLRKLSQNNRNKKEHMVSNQVAERLGCLPLAITQMAGIIRRQFMTYSEFLEIYRDSEEHADLHGKELAPRRETARGSLASIWAFEQLGAGARQVLQLLVFLDPDCVQEHILVQGLAECAHLSDFPRTRGAFISARAELIQSSLIRINEETGEWWVHRVLQDSVRTKLTASGSLVLFDTAFKVVNKAWPYTTLDKRHGVERWAQCNDIYPHIIRLRDCFTNSRLLFEQIPGKFDFATLISEAGW